MVKEVRKPLPESLLARCEVHQSGRTIRSVIADYKQALDECNGQIKAIREITNKPVELDEETDNGE